MLDMRSCELQDVWWPTHEAAAAPRLQTLRLAGAQLSGAAASGRLGELLWCAAACRGGLLVLHAVGFRNSAPRDEAGMPCGQARPGGGGGASSLP